MKVLFIENAGNHNAGAFHSLVSLIVLLRQFGVEGYVAIPDRADGIDMLEENGIPYITMRECSYTWMLLKTDGFGKLVKMPAKYFVVRMAAYRLAEYARKHGIEIIHENTSACYIGAYVAKITGIKHVWHIREFMEEDFEARIWWRRHAIKLMSSSDAVITISRAINEKYSKEFPAKILHQIYNGINIDVFYSDSQKDFDCDLIRVLCVGRVCEAKGQALLVKAAGILWNKYQKKIEVVLVGSCDRQAYEKIMGIASKCGIAENVDLLGQRNDIKQIYDSCHVLCMASRCEAFGRVTVEAMMSGCFVLGANSGGTKEIIVEGETGFLFESENAEALAFRLNEALADRNHMKKMAMQGREYAVQNYSAKKNAKNIYSLYCKLLNKA